MKIISFALFAILLTTSCETQKTLYSWDKYNESTYDYLKNSNEQSQQQLIETYQRIIENQKGTRKTIPPGVCADYGFLLLKMGKTDQGKELLQREMALYPESKVFVERILKMLEK